MSSVWDNNAELEIECPNCRRSFKAKLRDLRSSAVVCPKCGVGFDGTSFDKQLRDLDRQLKRAFK